MAYAQAPHGGPMTPPPGRPARPAWHWLVLGGIALAGLLLVAVFAAFIGWKILDRGDPERTVDDFYTSLQDADCELFMESTTDEFQEATGLTSCSIFDDHIEGISGVDYEVTDRVNRQGYAIFEVTESYSSGGQSESADLRFSVRRLDGQWDLDLMELVEPGSEPIA
ncbi:hypothetical protein BH708_07330 [Brachybacterium sp. P6-10-X1]|uniref:hypothetical protein n=1 Tax=Brachybacterium sp. P6-10-X1 TaxID=1903186 RepID=UPI0009718C83|nr:hypothetical protein [Brachybacterium sp. P6-10-X1]APX32563.1 hypothetical protein BH708_07330 [Brachybacterium sp. P6-10-X1]